MPLVTPDLIEDPCLEVLRTLHRQHLAKLERERGLPPRTIQPLQTVDLLIGEGVRLREDKPPVALLGLFGTERAPERDKNGSLTFDWTLAVQIVTVGTDRRDVIKRRGWYAMTVAECLMQRLPRHAEPVDALELLDVDFTNGRTQDQRPRTVGEAQLLLGVRVRASLSLDDLPSADTDWPPGTPGGPPADDYTPPEPWPHVADGYPHTTTEKEPL